MRILHVLRAPVGGLFRHVCDLARAQAARGHPVGIVAAAEGPASADLALRALEGVAALGVTRVAMARQIGPADLGATRHVLHRIATARPDVVHGHGAKGGAYARLAARASGERPVAVYTPHGGSLHYGRGSAQGLLFLSLERALLGLTGSAIFESAFARDVFGAKVGRLPEICGVVHNGLTPAEFEPIRPAPDASDFVFIGELRRLKGVDVLIEAVAARDGTTLTVVGAGPDAAAFEELARSLRVQDRVRFRAAMPARTGFALGRVLVVPSRAESLPYIVLEAIAAAVPLITTRVGGIPEIFGEESAALLPPGEVEPLAQALAAALADPAPLSRRADRLRRRVEQSFTVDAMAEGVLALYSGARTRAGEVSRECLPAT